MKYLLLFLYWMTNIGVYAQTPTKSMLYPGKIPNSKPAENLEKTEVNQWGVSFTTATSIPTITPYIPDQPNGKAVIICPGGGYFGTAGDHEGKQVAKALNAAGITAFVLKYRIPEDRYCIDKSLAPLQDAQQAIRLVRKNAAAWNIRPDRIGILGFSAGGHLAATAATHFTASADPSERDTTSVRPDFAVLIYPVISFSDSIGHLGSRTALLGEHPGKEQIRFFSNELQVTPQTPPTFLVHAEDDTVVPVSNSTTLYRACLQNKVPVEMHLYPKGGHGFGLNNPTAGEQWINLLTGWIKRL
ncbi:MAG: alpha/beta hydrolase [Saprospiraceae bacterium]|nr:alpha/beta hydrolase [Saprospiraceae bacterium]